MASSRADWVFGEARLISSPSTMLAKMPPGLNSNSRVCWLKTDTPGDVARQARSGGELDAADHSRDGTSESFGQDGLTDPGNVLDKKMPLREQHQDRHVYLMWLALYDTANRLFHLVCQRTHLGQCQGSCSGLGHGAPRDSRRYPDVEKA